MKPKLPKDYRERVYAGWIGKCAGVRLGAPVEGWTQADIQNHLGAIEGYLPLPPGKIFKPDDDTAAPLILIRVLEDFGPDFTAEQVGQTHLNYVGDQHGTFWWGGYANSTEHTAYLNLLAGIPAPISGSIALNGETVAEQIGGQIFSDIWGLVAPDNPHLAADFAARVSSVANDGNGIYGGRFVAALVSAAFSERDPLKLVETGLRVIPAESEYARVVTAVRDFYLKNPADWHACYQFLHDHFGYDRYPGAVHIIPNAGIVVMALLYSGGDFSRAIRIATEGGWDTDCNAGNVGAIMGVAVGLEGIPDSWRTPMNDVQVNASSIGARNLTDIPACADLFVRLGRQVAGLPPEPRPARYHFDYPGATQGFTADALRGTVIDVRNAPNPDGPGRALRVTHRKLDKKGELRLSLRTYYAPNELSANFYGASFSPKIYPGQTLRARLYLPPDSPKALLAGLYVTDGIAKESLQAVGQPLIPGQWQSLSFTIPARRSMYITEVGAVVRHEMDSPWNGSIWIDDLDWDGQPDFWFDFKRARNEYGAASGWTYLRGYWRLVNGGYHGSGYGVNESYSGDIDWQDYTLTVQLIPLLGSHHLVLARVHGAMRSYALGLAPGGKVALYKNDCGYRRVLEAPFAWELGQSTELSLACRGNHLSASVDGKAVFEWRDEEKPHLAGQIGLANFAGCHTRFERVDVRP